MEISVNINQVLNTLNHYSSMMMKYTNDEKLFTDIFKLSKTKLSEIKEEIAGDYLYGSIRILRYVIADKLQKGIIKSPEQIRDTIEQIKIEFNNNNLNYFKETFETEHPEALKFIEDYGSNKRDAFRNWGSYFRYLLPFIYSYHDREIVWSCLKNLIHEITVDLDIALNYECISTPNRWGEKIKSYYGFEGPSNYGSHTAALMIHPKIIPDHKNAIQFFCKFENGKIEAGWEIGWNLPKDIVNRLNLPPHNQHLQIVNSYEELVQRLKDVRNIVIDANKQLLMANTKALTSITIERNAEDEDDKDETANLYITNENGETEQVSDKIISSMLVNEIPPDKDYLERDAYAEYLSGIIKSKSKLSIGIYAQWGEGKTQLINLIKNKLSEDNDTKFIDFDAWQYNDLEHIWAALIMAFMHQCEKDFSFYLKYLVWKFCKVITYENIFKLIFWLLALYLFFPIFLKDFSLAKKLALHPIVFSIIFTLLPDLIKYPSLNINSEFLQCIKTPTYAEHLGFRNEIKDLINLTLTHLNNKDQKIVLVIDNLDRCSKDNIVKILDSINQFLTTCTDNKNFNLITIFAIDYEIVTAAISEKLSYYNTGSKAEEYLDKIIDFPFHIPTSYNYREFLEKSAGENNKDIIDYTEFLINNSSKQISLRAIRKIMNKLILLKKMQIDNLLTQNLENQICKDIATIVPIDTKILSSKLKEFGILV